MLLRILFAPAKRPALQLLAAVCAVISFVPAVLILGVCPRFDPERLRYLAAQVRVEVLTDALERYQAGCGNYPSIGDGLQVLGAAGPHPECWKGPYLEDLPPGPWGRPYQYLVQPGADVPQVLSYGADGVPGGSLLDADVSRYTPYASVPETLVERRDRHLALAVWAGSVLVLTGSLYYLVRSVKRRRP